MNTTSRLPVSQPEASRLSAYLTGALGTAALLGASQADAAVTSVTFGFGSVVSLSTGVPTDYTVHGLSNIYGKLAAIGSPVEPAVIYLGNSFSPAFGQVYQDSSFNASAGQVSFFTDGITIGEGGNGALGTGILHYPNNPAVELSSDQLNKNIGFRTSTGNWGWANVSWNNTASELTIHSAYVESVVGDTITVGDTGAIPEPATSAALLALAGLGVAASRRRPRPLAA